MPLFKALAWGFALCEEKSSISQVSKEKIYERFMLSSVDFDVVVLCIAGAFKMQRNSTQITHKCFLLDLF
jgi:hypothetical protein